jgi:nucleotide-binding universal stress UspA family protein
MMATVDTKPILVGVDGSEPSLAACRWAAAEAQLRGGSLQLIYGYVGPALAVPMMAPPYDWLPEVLQKEGEGLIAQAVAAVQAQAPQVPVTGRVLPGVAGRLLVELSGEASLVVLGHRGHGGFASLLLGSVASTVVAHAQAPVVVVRPGDESEPAGPGPVVVGVDGSESARAALEFGFAQAQRHGVSLQVVHAYQPPPTSWLADINYDPAEIEAGEQHELYRTVRPVQERYPDVPVSYSVVVGHPAGCLLEAAAGASLLVVGSRGRGGFTGLLLGAVSQQVVRHATSPVAVAR